MKLKPITIVSTSYRPHYQGISFRQTPERPTLEASFLQKAMKITQDPEQIKQMIGVKAVADVFNTLDNLDKMAIRKDYHKALVDCGVDFKFIVKGIKKECKDADKPADRLKAYQILLKSMGMDSYDNNKTEGGGGWEDALQKVIKNKEPMKKLRAPKEKEIEKEGEYDVVIPQVPDLVKVKKKLEQEEGKNLYE